MTKLKAGDIIENGKVIVIARKGDYILCMNKGGMEYVTWYNVEDDIRNFGKYFTPLYLNENGLTNDLLSQAIIDLEVRGSRNP